MSDLASSVVNRPRHPLALGLLVLLMARPCATPARAGNVPGDFDNDCDVDADDVAHFRACALGPSVPQLNPACADARLDGDQDADLDDFAILQRCYSGHGHAADPKCDPTCSEPDCNCLCGQTNCGSGCTYTAFDSANCGACGNVCPAGTTCTDGSCQPPCDPNDPYSACYCGPDHPYFPNCCPGGQAYCSFGCTSTDWDNGNCGLCGNVCPAGTTCQNGTCAACPAGGTWCSGVCTNVLFDTANCGGCGHVCSGGETCSGGVCQLPF